MNRGIGFSEFRLRQIDLDVVEAVSHILDLDNRIPAFVPLFPAITIGYSQIAPAHRFRADGSIRAQDDGDGMPLIARALRMKDFDGKSSIPSCQLKQAVVSNSGAHIF